LEYGGDERGNWIKWGRKGGRGDTTISARGEDVWRTRRRRVEKRFLWDFIKGGRERVLGMGHSQDGTVMLHGKWSSGG